MRGISTLFADCTAALDDNLYVLHGARRLRRGQLWIITSKAVIDQADQLPSGCVKTVRVLCILPITGHRSLLHRSMLSALVLVHYPRYIVTTNFALAGHSLGGALAQLAAHDIAREAQSCGKTVRVGCYTYGSPRVGNHAFAREFDQVCLLNKSY